MVNTAELLERLKLSISSYGMAKDTLVREAINTIEYLYHSVEDFTNVAINDERKINKLYEENNSLKTELKTTQRELEEVIDEVDDLEAELNATQEKLEEALHALDNALEPVAENFVDKLFGVPEVYNEIDRWRMQFKKYGTPGSGDYRGDELLSYYRGMESGLTVALQEVDIKRYERESGHGR